MSTGAVQRGISQRAVQQPPEARKSCGPDPARRPAIRPRRAVCGRRPHRHKPAACNRPAACAPAAACEPGPGPICRPRRAGTGRAATATAGGRLRPGLRGRHRRFPHCHAPGRRFPRLRLSCRHASRCQASRCHASHCHAPSRSLHRPASAPPGVCAGLVPAGIASGRPGGHYCSSPARCGRARCAACRVAPAPPRRLAAGFPFTPAARGGPFAAAS